MVKDCYINDSWLNSLIEEDKDSAWLEFSSQIARRVLFAIKERPELNQTKLAAQLGCSPQQVSKILKGKENLTLSTIAKLTQVLGIQLIQFPSYGWSNNPLKKETIITFDDQHLGYKFDFKLPLHKTHVINDISSHKKYLISKKQNVWQPLVKNISFEV